MSPEQVMILINGLLGLAFNAWASSRQILGEDALPSWAQIMEDNAALQNKIDQENKDLQDKINEG